MLKSIEEGERLLQLLELREGCKVIVDAGLPLKTIDFELADGDVAGSIRKVLKEFCALKFPTATLKIAAAGPRVSLIQTQSLIVDIALAQHFFPNGHINRNTQLLLNFIPEVHQAFEDLNAAYNVNRQYIVVEHADGAACLTLQASLDNLRTNGNWGGIMRAIVDAVSSFKAALDKLFLALPDIDAAKRRGLELKEEADRLERERREREVNDIFDELFNTKPGQGRRRPAAPQIDQVFQAAQVQGIDFGRVEVAVGGGGGLAEAILDPGPFLVRQAAPRPPRNDREGPDGPPPEAIPAVPAPPEMQERLNQILRERGQLA